MSASDDPKDRARSQAAPSADSARSVAAHVLVRVAKDKAFAAAALDAELQRRVQMQPRDRALATELVYGVLRLEPWLFARVERHATRGLDRNDPELTAPLLVCAYELATLERVPAFASVNEAVSLVRARRGEKVAGFANALLRKVAKEGRASAEELDQALIANAPPWLMTALGRALGDDGARAFLANARRPPPIGLRVLTGSREDALAALKEKFPDGAFELGRVSPLAILARDAGAPKELVAAMPDRLFVQEEGAQVVALALGAKKGDVVLDACAGRGNKTSLFARDVGEEGAVDAADVHPQKLERLKSELHAQGLAPRATFAVDLLRGVGDLRAGYTHIMVDAPCSGTGTLRRRPDILASRTAMDLAKLARTQIDIVARAATLLTPGGRLIYAVCSVLAEEGEDVVSGVLASDAGISPASFDAPMLSGVVPAESTSFRLLPHVHGTDGYFVASFRRGP